MLRAQKGLVQRIYLDAYDAAGSPATLTSPTVTITRKSDGSTVVTAATVLEGTEVGSYYYDLLPADSTSSIDTLTVTWNYTADSVAQSQVDTVDVVANRLCSPRLIDDSLSRGGTSIDYSARRIQVALSAAEHLFEAATDVPWCERFGQTTLDGPNWWRAYTYQQAHYLVLPVYPLRTVTKVTQDGTDLTASQLAALKVYESGRVYNPVSWNTGHGNLVVSYTYGVAATPPAVSRAVSLVATAILADGPFDDRGFGVTTDGGFVRLLTAGVGGAYFSIPEVQSVVKALGRTPAERILGVNTR